MSLSHLSVGDQHELEALPGGASEMRLPERLRLLDSEYRCVLAPDVAIGVSEVHPIFVAPCKCELTYAGFIPSAAITANDTNYAIIELYDGEPSAANVIASAQTKITAGTGDIAACALESLGTLDATHKILEAGDVLCIKNDQDTGGAGIAMADTLYVFKVVPVDGGE